MSEQPPPGEGFEPPYNPPPAPRQPTPPPGAPTYNNPAAAPPATEQLPGLPYEPPSGYNAGGAVPPPPQAQAPNRELANFGQRFLSWFIDMITVWAPFIALVAIMANTLPNKGKQLCQDRDDPTNIYVCEPLTDGSLAIFFSVMALYFVLALVYFAYSDGKSGQTLGKRAAGIRVVDDRSNGPIGIGRGVGRFFARYISSLVLFLGYLWAIWDKDNQTWHDKMVSSVVVRHQK